MYRYFNKDSLYYLNDNIETELKNLKIDYKPILKSNNLNRLTTIIHFIIYYLDTSRCNNIVFVDEEEFLNKQIINKLFPLVNLFFDYGKDIQDLKDDDSQFALIINNSYENMKFAKTLTEKYEPCVSLINYYPYSNDKYLDGLLVRNYFSIEEKVNLVVRE